MTLPLISAIETLYRELPAVDCQGCGQCCVSPTCTLSEWIYLFHNLIKNLSADALKDYLDTPAVLHPDFEGNCRCPFLDNTRCSVHSIRTGACRLFGIPSLKLLGIQNLEECKQQCSLVSGDSSPEFIQQWLRKLTALDASLYAFDADPYYITGFSIQCWNDIYFNELLDFDVFYDIKKAMQNHCDLSQFKRSYVQKTGIKEKIDKIGIFSTIIDCGDSILLKKILLSIRDDYPETGTYYYDEASAFLARLDSQQ